YSPAQQPRRAAPTFPAFSASQRNPHWRYRLQAPQQGSIQINARLISHRQLVRHGTQLQEWLHVAGQPSVVELVKPREVVNRLAAEPRPIPMCLVYAPDGDCRIGPHSRYQTRFASCVKGGNCLILSTTR